MKLKQVTELKDGVQYLIDWSGTYYLGNYNVNVHQICYRDVEDCIVYEIIPDSKYVLHTGKTTPLIYEVRLRNNNLMAAFCRLEDCMKYLDMIEPGIEHKLF